MTEEIAYLTLAQASALIRKRELSPVELTGAMLERCEELNSKLNAYVTYFPDDALDAAAQAEADIMAGNVRGPLHGIPIGVKDIYFFGPTTAGSKLREDFQASIEATAVRRLRGAGAIILGKHTTYELAFAFPSLVSDFPAARNPWNREYDPGGSSSGSAAAVAAGMAFGSMGSDTGGSIRYPACCCNVVGLKPTYGRVSRYGVFPVSWSLDHMGPLARSVEDAALMLQGCAGHDPLDGRSANVEVPNYTQNMRAGISGLRIGVPWNFFQSSCDPEILELFHGAVEQMINLGAQIVGVDLVSLTQALAATWPPLLSDISAVHLGDLRDRPEMFSRDMRLYLAAGILVDATSYVQAQRARRVIQREMQQKLEKADVFMLPTAGSLTSPIPPRPVGLNLLREEAMPLYTTIFNLTGFPAMSIPAGFTEDRRPVGFQLAAGPFDEALLFRAGHSYEQSQVWRDMHPDPLAMHGAAQS